MSAIDEKELAEDRQRRQPELSMGHGGEERLEARDIAESKRPLVRRSHRFRQAAVNGDGWIVAQGLDKAADALGLRDPRDLRDSKGHVDVVEDAVAIDPVELCRVAWDRVIGHEAGF